MTGEARPPRWTVTKSYEVAGLAFGVRSNSEAFAAWLDEALVTYRIPDELPSYYSILVAEEGKPGKRFHVLYEETKVLARSRDLATIARVLLSQLELLLLPERDDAIYAEMAVFASNGYRALAPGLLLPLLEAYSHREIERSGIVLPCSTTVAIDPDSGMSRRCRLCSTCLPTRCSASRDFKRTTRSRASSSTAL